MALERKTHHKTKGRDSQKKKKKKKCRHFLCDRGNVFLTPFLLYFFYPSPFRMTHTFCIWDKNRYDQILLLPMLCTSLIFHILHTLRELPLVVFVLDMAWKLDFYCPQKVRLSDKGGLLPCLRIHPPGRQLLEADTFHYCPSSHSPGNKLLIVLLPEGRCQGQQKGSQPAWSTQPDSTIQNKADSDYPKHQHWKCCEEYSSIVFFTH